MYYTSETNLLVFFVIYLILNAFVLSLTNLFIKRYEVKSVKFVGFIIFSCLIAISIINIINIDLILPYNLEYMLIYEWVDTDFDETFFIINIIILCIMQLNYKISKKKYHFDGSVNWKF